MSALITVQRQISRKFKSSFNYKINQIKEYLHMLTKLTCEIALKKKECKRTIISATCPVSTRSRQSKLRFPKNSESVVRESASLTGVSRPQLGAVSLFFLCVFFFSLPIGPRPVCTERIFSFKKSNNCRLYLHNTSSNTCFL